MKKIVLISTVLAVMASGLCFSSGSREAVQPKEEVVTISAWMGSWWKDDIPKVVAAFEAEHPNRKLTIEPVPINGYLEKAITAVLGGNPPDILSLDANFIASMAGRNLLQTWDEYIKDLDALDFNQSIWTAGIVNGKQYALAYRGSSGVYFINKTMFEGAGLPYPKEGWTYQDQLEMAKKITVPGDKYGIGIAAALSDPANVFSSFAPVLWAFKGEFISSDNKKARINEPEGVAGIKWWTELYTKYKVVPGGSINFSITKDVVPMFINNKVAMFPGSSAQFSMLNERPEVKWFSIVGPDGWNRGGGWAYGIPSTSAHPKEAREYGLWFVKPENQAKLMIRQPARSSATTVPPWNTEEYKPVFAAGKYSRLLPIIPQWGETSNLIITELQKIMQGAKTPQQGADDMAKQMNALLSK